MNNRISVHSVFHYPVLLVIAVIMEIANSPLIHPEQLEQLEQPEHLEQPKQPERNSP